MRISCFFKKGNGHHCGGAGPRSLDGAVFKERREEEKVTFLSLLDAGGGIVMGTRRLFSERHAKDCRQVGRGWRWPWGKKKGSFSTQKGSRRKEITGR